MTTKELLALYFDEPHREELRLSHPGTSPMYQYMVEHWVGSTAMEENDIKRFADNPDTYNTLDVACCRVDHIFKRIAAGNPLSQSDQYLIQSLCHTLSPYALDILMRTN